MSKTSTLKTHLITIENIAKADLRLTNIIERTPLQYNQNLSEQYGANIFLKREDLQVVRSYKIRGAYNLMSSLSPEEQQKGVVCASAGNHAQGFAYSCHLLGIEGKIYMPTTTPKQKFRQVERLGKGRVDIILEGDTFDDANKKAVAYSKAHQKIFVPPFEHPAVIEGQATIGMEILQQCKGKPIDYVLMPIGGGGLCAGVSTYFHAISPHTKIIGVEPEGAAAMYAARQAGEVVTLAKIDTFVDGAAVKQVGKLNFELIDPLLHDLYIVPEGRVCMYILQMYNQNAIVVEPAGALSIAALEDLPEEAKGKNIVCIVSGGNNDIERMPEIKERSLLYQKLKHYFIVNFPQRAGALREFLDKVLGPDDDITHFSYTKKTNRSSGPALVGIELKNPEDYTPLIQRMKMHGIEYTSINEQQDLFQFLV